MRYLRLAYLVTGLVLLGVTFYEADLGAVWHYVRDFGPWGTALITALFLLAYLADAAAWQLTLPGIPGTARWLQRLFVVRTIGEAFNDITPFASLGGSRSSPYCSRRTTASDIVIPVRRWCSPRRS